MSARHAVVTLVALTALLGGTVALAPLGVDAGVGAATATASPAPTAVTPAPAAHDRLTTRWPTTTDSGSASTARTQQSSDVVLGATVGRDRFITRGSYASDATVTIWASAADGRGLGAAPVSGVQLTINVTRQNRSGQRQQVASFTRTTGTNGAATVDFDLTGRADGFYVVTVSSPAARTDGGTGFFAGTYTEVYPSGELIDPDRGIEGTVRVTEGDEPVAGATRSLTIFDESQQIGATIVTTNQSGVASFEYPVPGDGRYRIITNGSTQAVAFGRQPLVANDVRASVLVGGDNLVVGQRTAIAGRVVGDGVYANQQVTVELVDPVDGVVNTTDVTTDATGQFLASFRPPAAGSYEVQLRTAGGDSIAVATRNDLGADVFVSRPDSGSGPDASGSNVTLELDPGAFEQVAPGESISVVATVRDNGTAVAGATVNLTTGYGFGGVTVGRQTATTDATGQAQFTVTTDSDAPRGQLSLFAATTVDGENGTAVSFRPLGPTQLDTSQIPRSLTSGGTVTLPFQAVDVATDAGIGGTSVGVVGVAQTRLHASTLFAGAQSTAADGQAAFDENLPETVTGDLKLFTASPAKSAPAPFGGSADVTSSVANYSVTLQGLTQDDYRPNATVTLSYTTTASATVRGVLIVESLNSERVTEPVVVAQRLAPGESVQVTLPGADDNRSIFYEVRLRTVTTAGVSTFSDEFVEVDAPSDGGTGQAPDVDGDGQPARDLNGDGDFEDVNGDGGFGILDVAVFLNNFDGSASDPAFFDFNDDGGVSIIDVATLLDRL